MNIWFAFFALSGFCGLLYETLWLRLSMAQFGVTSPSLSIVVSVFMAGMALGAWLVSKAAPRLSRLDARGAMRAYAAAELGIALLSLPVPFLLRTGGAVLTSLLAGHGATAWYAAALVWQFFALLPATALMGATIPLGMNAIAKAHLPGERTSFSFLYLANVLGATLGTLLSAFVIIELLGFTRTLLVAALVNTFIGLLAFVRAREVQTAAAAAEDAPKAAAAAPRGLLVLIFATGFCSLGIEVVWTRQLTPYLGTVVYAFALVLAIYLLSTFAGSVAYRRFAGRGFDVLDPALWLGIAVLGALALLAVDAAHFGVSRMWDNPRGWGPSIALIRPFVAVVPFSAALGFVTPQLVDRFSAGDAGRAARAYAVNTVGCILGPLLAGFALLPVLSESTCLLLLLAPFALAALVLVSKRRLPVLAVEAAALVALALWPRSLERLYPREQLERDHTATTIATGKGMRRQLFVNGVSMTTLTPATKMMAHLPSAMRERPPRNALVICFGMGTSFRSLTTWNIPVTAVELVPGVPKLFGYFHADAAQVLASPGARVVADDGRRFLENSNEKFDVIVIDPPPPVSAASSSLLYSVEFYDLIKKRLAPGGILQQWIPGGDSQTLVALLRALEVSFPYRIVSPGFGQGMHILVSDQPLQMPTAKVLASRLPPRAAADLIEWGPEHSAEAQFQQQISRSFPELEKFLAAYPGVAPLDDDLPLNEYYLLRAVTSR
jgi:spermidine synthase